MTSHAPAYFRAVAIDYDGTLAQPGCQGLPAHHLEAELAVCDEGVLRHHCPGHDFPAG
jgi:hypothetical protein